MAGPATLREAWPRLADRISGCVACEQLAAMRRTVVVGQWPAGARLALVGEAPGAQEDETGRPFVGRGGQLLDTVLAQAGLRRDEIAVLNVLKCRPPDNRRPTGAEIERCRPWLASQLALVQPRLVVALGLTAVQWFLGRRTTLSRARGTVHDVAGLPVLATYHPSAALRFGPRGEPMAALQADLAQAAQLLAAGAPATGNR